MNSLNITAYLSLQTYSDCFVFAELASESSVIFLSLSLQRAQKAARVAWHIPRWFVLIKKLKKKNKQTNKQGMKSTRKK